jgi:uncharacterized lipoprotein YmbA
MVLGFLATLLAGCASSDPNYFTLQPVTGALHSTSAKMIEIRRVTLAGYLDRAEILRDTDSYKLDLASNARWAEPLGDMTGRVIAADLSQRLPGATVFNSTGAITQKPDARIELDVTRFDADAAGVTILTAVLAISQGDRRRAETITLKETGKSNGIAARAATMSVLLGELADRIAVRIEDISIMRNGDSISPKPGQGGDQLNP